MAETDVGTALVHLDRPPTHRLRTVCEELPATKRWNDPGPDTAHAVARVVHPFLTDDATCAVAGASTRMGRRIVVALREAGARPVPLDKGDDLRSLPGMDVVVEADPRLWADTARHLGPGTSLLVRTGSEAVRTAADSPPCTAIADAACLAAVEAAVFAERAVQAVVAPHLRPWRYLVAGPSGRLTSAGADVLTALREERGARFEDARWALSTPCAPPARSHSIDS
ncbi:hypothetical protein [Pseudonocardia spirodelae]|uniref:Uncharacterized protein n=1 Tax=Pseudonocardia spirodelae TaxID=3133431 RepID=A0ABU8T6R8_9PSEU